MPKFASSLLLPFAVETLFDFLATPAHWPTLAPPDLHLQLLDSPARLVLGAKASWKVRRWGIAQQIRVVVTAFELNSAIVLDQQQGPFARWQHAQSFTASDQGVLLNEEIDFAPPTGMLGRLVTDDSILRDLETLFAFRHEQLRRHGAGSTAEK